MHVMVIGAAGMLGQKLVNRICQLGRLGGKRITKLTLVDIVEFKHEGADIDVSHAVGDLSDENFANHLAQLKPDCIFNLAAVVSGEAEEDFLKGYKVNLDGLRNLLESIRTADFCPKLVFASSIAVFGAPFPDAIGDDFIASPLTSYGIQKACCELLVTDYSRKGFIDGISLRLPTIVVRPGKPNKAASGFFSNIIREPLIGKTAILPVSRDVRHWIASPSAAVGFFIHAAEIDSNRIGPRKAVTMPGISVTVGEMMDSLGRVAGSKTVELITDQLDEKIAGFVRNWPRNFETKAALALGFSADRSMDDIIQSHIDEELGGRLEYSTAD